jgi:hypothetical protein
MINPRGLVHIDKSLIAQDIKFFNELIVAISSVKGETTSHEASKKAMVDDLTRLEADSIIKTINSIGGYVTNRMAKVRAKKDLTVKDPKVKSDVLDCTVKEFYEQEYLKDQYGSSEELKEKLYGPDAINYWHQLENKVLASERRDRLQVEKKKAPKEFKGAKVKTMSSKAKKLEKKLKDIMSGARIGTSTKAEKEDRKVDPHSARIIFADKPIKKPIEKKVAKKAKKRVVKKPAKKSKKSAEIKKAVNKVVKKKAEPKKKPRKFA